MRSLLLVAVLALVLSTCVVSARSWDRDYEDIMHSSRTRLSPRELRRLVIEDELDRQEFEVNSGGDQSWGGMYGMSNVVLPQYAPQNQQQQPLLPITNSKNSASLCNAGNNFCQGVGLACNAGNNFCQSVGGINVGSSQVGVSLSNSKIQYAAPLVTYASPVMDQVDMTLPNVPHQDYTAGTIYQPSFSTSPLMTVGAISATAPTIKKGYGTSVDLSPSSQAPAGAPGLFGQQQYSANRHL